MSSGENKVQRIQHAFLVVWSWFAEHIGLIWRFFGGLFGKTPPSYAPNQSAGIYGLHFCGNQTASEGRRAYFRSSDPQFRMKFVKVQLAECFCWSDHQNPDRSTVYPLSCKILRF